MVVGSGLAVRGAAEPGLWRTPRPWRSWATAERGSNGPRGERLAEDLFGDLAAGDLFLTSPATLRWLREEIHLPSAILDRRPRQQWQADGLTAVERAARRVQDVLAHHQPTPLADDVRRQLLEIITRDARKHGMDRLPGHPASA